jgi:hypothetical protein
MTATNIETERLTFIEMRDGKAAAMVWATEKMKSYKNALLQTRRWGHARPHHATLPQFRKSFIESYLAFKKYIKEQ